MSAVSKSYTFIPGTDIESAEVNQNFDDLVNYTNSEVIVRDASKAFTVTPSGPGTDPTSPNQFTRKQYVDNQDTAITSSVTALTTTVSGHTTDLTKRPTINNNATGVKMTSQTVSTATDANGDVTINFPAGHLTTCTNVVAISGNINASPSTQISTISLIGFTNTGFNVRVYKTTSGAAFGTYFLEPAVSQGVQINYIATGT
jgi:hypothetical protein